jgi:transposase
MILDLARQGLTVSAIARRTGHDRKTIRTYIARGLEPPAYKPRPPAPSPLAPFEAFLRERVGRFPDLTGRRLWREVRDLGFVGGYSTVTDFLRTIRPPATPTFERRFETPPGRQAQVDFGPVPGRGVGGCHRNGGGHRGWSSVGLCCDTQL